MKTQVQSKSDQVGSRNLVLMTALHHAIEQDKLDLYYQPKIDLKTNQVIGVEALLRWEHPEWGVFSLEQLIGLAERTGLIQPLSQWVFDTAHRQCLAFHEMGIDINIAINLSSRNIQDSEMLAIFVEKVKNCNEKLGSLELEITENTIRDSPEGALELMDQLSPLGITFTIDNFGTGYSSLSFLQKLPMSTLKIDRSFVMDMATNEANAAMVRLSIDLGHSLGFLVVAQGVENKETFEALVEMGCDAAQGYYICEPISSKALATWFAIPRTIPRDAHDFMRASLKEMAQVKKAKDEWETTLDSLPQLVCLLDENGLILRANKTVETWKLCKLSEVQGLALQDLFPSISGSENCPLKNIWTRAKIALVAGQSLEVEDLCLSRYLRFHISQIVPRTRRDNRETKSFAVVIVEDITERKIVEDELLLLGTAIGQADEAVFITNSRGVIDYVNPAAERHSGYEKKELIGQSMNILKSGKHSPEFYQDLWSTIQQGKVWHGSFVNRKKDGSFCYEKETISPVLDKSGQIKNYVAIKQDVTHEIMLEERLRQSLKMESIGVVASGIAHEISQPLNTIKVRAESLLFIDVTGPGALTEKIRYNLEIISKEVDRIDTTVRHMRSFFRKDQQGKPSPLSINTVIRRSFPLISERLLAHNIVVEKHIEKKLPTILGNEVDLEQVLLNLVGNAIHAIDLTRKGSGTIYISAYVENAHVFLRVRDTGIGIPEEIKEAIFDPLFTTSKTEQNLGLGLAIVKTILDTMGANIRVENHPEGGAVFTIQFKETLHKS